MKTASTALVALAAAAGVAAVAMPGAASTHRYYRKEASQSSIMVQNFQTLMAAMEPMQPIGAAAGNNTASVADQMNQLLAQGIAANMMAQMGEMLTTTTIQQLEAGSANNMEEFAVAKANLLEFVNAGIKIRENNQRIAPADNAAVPGLQKVQMAQEMELNLAQSLTGDASNDNAVTQKLQTAFSAGFMQNAANKQAAVDPTIPATMTVPVVLGSMPTSP